MPGMNAAKNDKPEQRLAVQQHTTLTSRLVAEDFLPAALESQQQV